MIEMRVVGVRVEMPNQQPVLILTEVDGSRSIPIMVGSSEATAIAMQLQGMTPPRPMTHDLFRDTLIALGRTLTEVRVVDFREGTFYGELVFGPDVTVSARPSDAIALAVRCEVPVYVAESVLAETGIVIPTAAAAVEGDGTEAEPIVDPEGEMERFREFLDNVSPEDFDPEGEQ
ncbi:MAG: bifunctional nuclease family protein [Nakamurella sp.]